MPFLEAWHEAAITSLGLFWTAFWAFALGYVISSLIQVFVTRKRMQELMGKDGPKSIVLGTVFGFISSSCSFAALAGARSLFTKGAGLVPSLAFLLASTNLVIELGILIAVFLDWPFVLAEYIGGLLLILAMWVIVHFTTQCVDVEAARRHAKEHENQGEGGHQHHDHGGNDHEHEPHGEDKADKTNSQDFDVEMVETNESDSNGNKQQNDDKSRGGGNEHCQPDGGQQKSTTKEKWEQVAMKYCMEWGMVWKDVTVGFTVAGVIASFVPKKFFEVLFIGSDSVDAPNFGQVLEQIVVGPVIAFFTFIGSMGNIPLAAVLYSNGVSFAGIIAFIFSDLVVFPILRIHAKFYGWSMAIYILMVFLLSLVSTALVLHYFFDAIGILPSSDDQDTVIDRDHFKLNYTFALNIVFLCVTAVCLGFYLSKKGLPKINPKGQSIVEQILFYLAWVAYGWLIGGLFAGLA